MLHINQEGISTTNSWWICIECIIDRVKNTLANRLSVRCSAIMATKYLKEVLPCLPRLCFASAPTLPPTLPYLCFASTLPLPPGCLCPRLGRSFHCAVVAASALSGVLPSLSHDSKQLIAMRFLVPLTHSVLGTLSHPVVNALMSVCHHNQGSLSISLALRVSVSLRRT